MSVKRSTLLLTLAIALLLAVPGLEFVGQFRALNELRVSVQVLGPAIYGGGLLGLSVRLNLSNPTSFYTPEMGGSISLYLGNLQLGSSPLPSFTVGAHSSRAVELKLTVSALNITQAFLSALASGNLRELGLQARGQLTANLLGLLPYTRTFSANVTR